ncbi:sulfotransferase domain-containing protein [Rubripirellula amarantea]|nr:sulfotransferase domain-containing protein [Rubripirellula amarantea]
MIENNGMQNTAAAEVHVDCFLIGVPKAGTTWLAGALQHHPEVCFSEPKEVDELSDHRGTFNRLPRPVDWNRYRQAFGDRPGLRIDGSIHAFSDPDAPRKFSHWYPNAKFILCIRQPVDRAVSHWNMIRAGTHLEPNGVDWSDFAIAWRDGRLHGDSLYGRCFSRWLQFYDTNRFLIAKSENMKHSPTEVLSQVHEFLGVSDHDYSEKALELKHQSSDLKSLNPVGRSIRNAIPRNLRTSFKRVMPWLSYMPHRFPLFAAPANTLNCTDYHHGICANEVLPDMEQFESLSGIDMTQWIEETRQAAARIKRLRS